MISCFDWEYHYLSNFARYSVNYIGILYPTSEHAYQSFKTIDPDIRRSFKDIGSPYEAKKKGLKLELREDWDDIKDLVMYEIVLAKFSQHIEIRKKLINTGEQLIVERNTWGDTYWGVCDGQGQNKLGIILMKVREELRPQIEPYKLDF